MSIRLGVAMIGEISRVHTVFSNTGLGGFVTREWPTIASKSVRAVARSMRRELKSTSIRPNSVLTIALKGSSIPLIDSKLMLQSIIEKKVSNNEYYGGINPDVRYPANGLPVWIAALRHSWGYVIPVTEKIRAMFQALGFYIKPETKHLTVPPRPFVPEGLNKGIEEAMMLIKKLPGGMREVFAKAR